VPIFKNKNKNKNKNVKASTNPSSTKIVILFWDIMELMSFLHHAAFAYKAEPN
jgi:hypothetical protein